MHSWICWGGGGGEGFVYNHKSLGVSGNIGFLSRERGKILSNDKRHAFKQKINIIDIFILKIRKRYVILILWYLFSPRKDWQTFSTMILIFYSNVLI